MKGRLLASGDIQTLSQGLSANEPVTIDAGVSLAPSQVNDNLKKTLLGIEGVLSVNWESGMIHLGCSRNAAADIARVIVESGASLDYLHKREYGLDDIYNHYFKEKIESHE